MPAFPQKLNLEQTRSLKKNRKPQKLPGPTLSANPSPTVLAPVGKPRSPWWFRLAALTLVPLVLFFVAEVGLRLAGVGCPTHYFLKQPVKGQACNVENQRFGRRFFPPNMVRHPLTCVVPEHKGANTLRIFVFGESAAMGDPEPSFGFARVLEVLLRERYPEKRIEVINTAFTAINSHVIWPIARECAPMEGDLWVVYMGNNEVVGPYGAGTVFGAQVPPLGMIRFNLALKSFRLGQIVQSVASRLGGASQSGNWGGMEMFLNQKVPADDPRLVRVREYFRRNLRDIMQTGADSGAGVLVCTPLSNVRDCAPFASVHRSGLSPDDLGAWEHHYASGNSLALQTNHAAAVAEYGKAGKIDGHHADLAFRHAQSLLALGQETEARALFIKARDLDALRFRPDTALIASIREEVAAMKSPSVALVDTDAQLADRSPHHLAGRELLYEHVHPSFEGHYAIGLMLAEQADQMLSHRPELRLQSKAPWLSRDECARRLAWTGYDQALVLETLLKRMARPPFAQQSNIEEQKRFYQAEYERLKPQTKSYALKRFSQQYSEETARVPGDWTLLADHARLVQSMGDSQAAIPIWQAVLDLAPCHPQAHCNLGIALWNLGRADVAQASFEQARRLCPELPEALVGLARIHMKNGAYRDALPLLKRALALSPESPDIMSTLGDCHLAMGNKGQALRLFSRVLEIDPRHASAQQGVTMARRP